MEANLRETCTTRTVEVVSLLKEVLQVCRTVKRKETHFRCTHPISSQQNRSLFVNPTYYTPSHSPGCSIRDKTCLNCSLRRPWWSIKCNLPGRLRAIPCTPIPSARFTGTHRTKFFKRFRSTQILKWLRLSYSKVSHQPWSMAGCTKHNSHKC